MTSEKKTAEDYWNEIDGLVRGGIYTFHYMEGDTTLSFTKDKFIEILEAYAAQKVEPYKQALEKCKDIVSYQSSGYALDVYKIAKLALEIDS